MRVLFVVSGLARGGAEAMLLKLLSRIDRARFHPAVVSLAEASDLAEEIRLLGIELHTLGLRSPRGLLYAGSRFIRLVRRIRPDIIQGWMLHGNVAASLAGACLGIPVFWGVRHSRLLPQTQKKANLFLQWLLGRASRFPARGKT